MAVYGIDLGTTYSCICKFEDGQVSVIPNELDEKSTASAVYFGENSNIVVGDEAKDYVQTEGHRVIQFVKREIGKAFPPHEMDGREYNAIEISALILKKLAKYASDAGENVKDVVITCPAYFGNEERDATKKAGILAGFNVLEIINEPTAAAISYAFRSASVQDEVVAVYDLGGGTFDVTVLDIKANPGGVPSCRVLATGGDDTLGGKDWDDELFRIICRNMMDENSLSELTAEDEYAIRSITEKTKKSLSSREKVTDRAEIDGESQTCEQNREHCEEATAFLLQKTTDCLDRIFSLPQVTSVKISKILLVGGSSNMPMVSRTLKERYGDCESMNELAGLSDSPYTESIPVVFSDPETAVAKGAAIYANILSKASARRSGGFMDEADGPVMEIHDIASRTFGTDTTKGGEGCYLHNFVYKGDEIPTTVESTFYPVVDNQSGILFWIYESIIEERGLIPFEIDHDTGELIDPNPAYGLKYLGKLFLPFPPNTSKETAVICAMSVSGSGIHVRVQNTRTGDEETVDIEFTNNQVDMDDNHINALSLD